MARAEEHLETVHLPLGRRPPPPAGQADVWLIDLQDLPLDTPGSGVTRHQRIMQRRIRQRFFLRLLLSAYLGCPGKDIRLTRSARGKPALAGQHADTGLEFNLSHCGSWLAVAVATGVAVGIDIERERELVRVDRLAQRCLSAAEAQWLKQLDQPFRSHRFLHQWCAREALVKARGCGLAGMLDEMELGWNPAAIRRLPASWLGREHMGLTALSLPDGLIGQLASMNGALKARLRLVAAAAQPPEA